MTSARKEPEYYVVTCKSQFLAGEDDEALRIKLIQTFPWIHRGIKSFGFVKKYHKNIYKICHTKYRAIGCVGIFMQNLDQTRK